MGKTVRKLWAFSRLDYRAAEQYLERQAAKGYLLKEISQPFLLWAVYEKTEPKRVKYCIDGLAGSREERQEYLDFAADGGWHKVCRLPGQAVFVSEEGKNPPPMQTDWKNEYRQMRKSLWKLDFPVGIFLIVILWIAYKLLMLEEDSFPIEELIEACGPVEFVLAVFITSYFAVFLRGIFFYLRSEIAMRRDKPLKPSKPETGRFWSLMHIAGGCGFVLLFLHNSVRGLEEQAEIGDMFSILIRGALIVMLVLVLSKKQLGENRVKKSVLGIGIFALVLLFVQCSINL